MSSSVARVTSSLTTTWSNSVTAASSCAGGGQAPLALLGPLGAAPDQAVDELVPRRRGEEDELGLGHRDPHLPGALEVELEEDRAAGGELALDGLAGGAVAVHPVHDGPLEHLAGGDELVEPPRG